MHLKITGLKVDMGEETSPKSLAKKANRLAQQIEEEHDPDKKKFLKEKEAKGDMHEQDLEHGEGEKAEKKHKKKQKKTMGGAADPASGTVGGPSTSGGAGNGGGGGQ